MKRKRRPAGRTVPVPKEPRSPGRRYFPLATPRLAAAFGAPGLAGGQPPPAQAEAGAP